MPVSQPGSDSRWRCTLCGNLTRFDVTRRTRATEYVHVDLAGEQAVEERELLEDAVEHVTCRWCKAVDQVELVPRPAAGSQPEGPGPDGARRSVGGPA